MIVADTFVNTFGINTFGFKDKASQAWGTRSSVSSQGFEMCIEVTSNDNSCGARINLVDLFF